jgi:hypothetical protein
VFWLQDGRFPLLFASVAEDVQLLVHNGASIMRVDRDGKTCVAWAAARGDIGLVQEFLRCATAIEQRDLCTMQCNRQMTVFDHAVEGLHVAVVEFLLRKKLSHRGSSSVEVRRAAVLASAP